MEVKCPKCNYEWDTKSKLDSICCPNCQRKFEKGSQLKIKTTERGLEK